MRAGLLLFSILIFGCLTATANFPNLIIYTTNEDSIAPDSTNMRDLTPFELTAEMTPGWNVGNSLDAIGGETAWSNPLISPKLIDSVKAAGFNCVRIPVAWSKFSDESTYTIKTEWLERVEEVVNYVLDSKMYAIVNIHWDNGWMQPTYEKQNYVNTRLAAMWNQIAIQFRDYNDSLIFAGTNEVMVDGDYSTPTKEYYTVQNSFNQTFVTTVRATGGRNAYRFLAVQGFNTNITYTCNYLEIPEDTTPGKLIVEVHYYDPYNFTLNGSSSITQWGEYATSSLKTETWANESYADSQFGKMKTSFVDEGYAVIVGEYGAISRTSLGSDYLNEEHAEFRRYYIDYITNSMYNNGLIPIVWDNGYTGDNSLGLFSRYTGKQVYAKIIDAIVTTDVVEEVDLNFTSVLESDAGLLNIYPIPANETVNIDIDEQPAGFAHLYNYYGLLVTNLDVKKGTNSYNVNFLETGIYVLHITTRNNFYSKKIFID